MGCGPTVCKSCEDWLFKNRHFNTKAKCMQPCSAYVTRNELIETWEWGHGNKREENSLKDEWKVNKFTFTLHGKKNTSPSLICTDFSRFSEELVTLWTEDVTIVKLFSLEEQFLPTWQTASPIKLLPGTAFYCFVLLLNILKLSILYCGTTFLFHGLDYL